MKIGVDVHNTDLGEQREVTEPSEQVALLCAAITHADRERGWEVRALMALAHAIVTVDDGVAKSPLWWALLDAAGAAAMEARTSRAEATEYLGECWDIAAEMDRAAGRVPQ